MTPLTENASSDIERAVLAEGHEISRLIRGGWQLAGDHGPVDPARVSDDLLAFYDAGITTLDCADIYTGVESMIGDFRRHLGNTRGEDAAARLKIHTKFVPDLAILPAITSADVTAIIDRSLQRLGQDRLDLVQFHWWDYAQPRVIDAALALRDLQREGKIRLIGGTNFDAAHVGMLADAGVPFASVQVQYSLLDRRPAQAMAGVAARLGMHYLCYGTLAGGFFDEAWLGVADPIGTITNRSRIKYRLIIDEYGGWDAFQALLAVLGAVARRHDARIAQVAARWVLDQPHVAAVIIGASHPRHLPATRAIMALHLDAADHARIAAVLQPGPQGAVYALERDRDGPHGRIMKYNLSTAAR
ncbi:MAG: aldo/keto reductase [Sandarakinorhabdus sp.]